MDVYVGQNKSSFAISMERCSPVTRSRWQPLTPRNTQKTLHLRRSTNNTNNTKFSRNDHKQQSKSNVAGHYNDKHKVHNILQKKKKSFNRLRINKICFNKNSFQCVHAIPHDRSIKTRLLSGKSKALHCKRIPQIHSGPRRCKTRMGCSFRHSGCPNFEVWWNCVLGGETSRNISERPEPRRFRAIPDWQHGQYSRAWYSGCYHYCWYCRRWQSLKHCH